jgi:NAD(P)-dependent dehydrogenase (short-subunit alcohol dehydrogenase family)
MESPDTDPKKGRLSDQVAVITGGTVGIGRATCLALAGEGASIVIVGRNRNRLEEVLQAVTLENDRSRTLGLLLDVRSEIDMQEMANRTMVQFGRLDILICAAGILRASGGNLRTLQKMSPEEWDEVIDTNLKGVFLANRAVLPIMMDQRRGEIINLSSTSGRKGLAFDSAYCASKFGVIGLSESLGEEMRQYGIRVQLLLPGAIETGMWDQNGPLPRPTDILTPEQVAKVILFMVTLPEDSTLTSPTLEPFLTKRGTGWLGMDSSGQR